MHRELTLLAALLLAAAIALLIVGSPLAALPGGAGVQVAASALRHA